MFTSRKLEDAAIDCVFSLTPADAQLAPKHSSTPSTWAQAHMVFQLTMTFLIHDTAQDAKSSGLFSDFLYGVLLDIQEGSATTVIQHMLLALKKYLV